MKLYGSRSRTSRSQMRMAQLNRPFDISRMEATRHEPEQTLGIRSQGRLAAALAQFGRLGHRAVATVVEKAHERPANRLA